MHLSVVGSGYVGTTIVACFADLGHDVVNIDIDENIVTTINDGEAPSETPSNAGPTLSMPATASPSRAFSTSTRTSSRR